MCLPLPASASPTVARSRRLLLPGLAVWLGRGTHPLGGKSWRSDVASEESAGQLGPGWHSATSRPQKSHRGPHQASGGYLFLYQKRCL